MTWAFICELGAFSEEQMSQHARHDACATYVEALVYVNRLWLPFHPETPPLYESGVVFAEEELGAPNYWRDIPTTLVLGYGHCVALAAWRLAELQERGEAAKVRITEWHPAPGQIDFHIHVLRGNGTVEDPARELGMP